MRIRKRIRYPKTAVFAVFRLFIANVLVGNVQDVVRVVTGKGFTADNVYSVIPQLKHGYKLSARDSNRATNSFMSSTKHRRNAKIH